MVLFGSQIAFALELIAIVLATFLVAVGMEKKIGLAKIIGVIVLIVAILALLHTAYSAYMISHMVYTAVMHSGTMAAS